MGGACRVYGGEEKRILGFDEKPEGKRGGRIMLRWIFRKWDVGL
jgi:hypothetical protein